VGGCVGRWGGLFGHGKEIGSMEKEMGKRRKEKTGAGMSPVIN
jgi:hypothetical protein